MEMQKINYESLKLRDTHTQGIIDRSIQVSHIPKVPDHLIDANHLLDKPHYIMVVKLHENLALILELYDKETKTGIQRNAKRIIYQEKIFDERTGKIILEDHVGEITYPLNRKKLEKKIDCSYYSVHDDFSYFSTKDNGEIADQLDPSQVTDIVIHILTWIVYKMQPELKPDYLQE